MILMPHASTDFKQEQQWHCFLFSEYETTRMTQEQVTPLLSKYYINKASILPKNVVYPMLVASIQTAPRIQFAHARYITEKGIQQKTGSRAMSF